MGILMMSMIRKKREVYPLKDPKTGVIEMNPDKLGE